MVFKEKNTISIPICYKSFIYFLIKDNDVVYVGQTKNNLTRPFSHKDKDFNRIEILLCEENELDLIENKYILKYQPIYNTRINDGYKLITSRNKLRNLLNNKELTKRDIRKALNILGLKTVWVGNNEYLNNEIIIELFEYFKGE